MQHYKSRQELVCVGGWLYHYYKCPLLYNYYGASIKRITRPILTFVFFSASGRDFFAAKNTQQTDLYLQIICNYSQFGHTSFINIQYTISKLQKTFCKIKKLFREITI